MKLDTAVRRLTSAEGGHSPHPVSAGLLLLKQYWTFFSGQFGHKHHFSRHCRLDPDENQMDLSIWSNHFSLMVIIELSWLWMSLSRSPICRFYIHFHCTSVNFLFDSLSVPASVFAFSANLSSFVSAARPHPCWVFVLIPKLAKVQIVAAEGQCWLGIPVTGQRNADEGLCSWVCG